MKLSPMRSLIWIVALLTVACTSSQTSSEITVSVEPELDPVFGPGLHQMVYKTKADYDSLVPVVMSDDKTEILSFPDISMIKDSLHYPLPGKLHNGYLLDNAGIWKNVAFLKYTYKQYAELDTTPSAQELLSKLADKDPLTEICDCGNRSLIADPEKQINSLIDSKRLSEVCKLIGPVK